MCLRLAHLDFTLYHLGQSRVELPDASQFLDQLDLQRIGTAIVEKQNVIVVHDALCCSIKVAHRFLIGFEPAVAREGNVEGVEGVQLDVAGDLSLPYLFHPSTKYTLATPAGIEQLAADAKAASQQITALCMHNRFEGHPENEIQWCSKVARAACALNVPVIRIDLVPIKLSRHEFLKLAIQTLGKIIVATESTGVRFAVENHSNTTNDPTFLNSLFDAVCSKRLGLTLDMGNFYWFGHPLSKVYELCEWSAPQKLVHML